MKHIQKRNSPPAFEAWKAAHDPKNWDDLKNSPAAPEAGVVYFSKSDLRENLVREQGFLCCYCQQRIDLSEKTKIEHFFPKDGADKAKGKALMFDYQNLLAACPGGQNEKATVVPRQTYCDHSKSEQEIPLSPLTENIESQFTFLQTRFDKVEIIAVGDGNLPASQTIEILNLNAEILQKRRSEQIAGLIFSNPEKTDLISPQEANVLLQYFENEKSNPTDGQLPVFLTAQIHFLKLFAG